jgi:transposase
MTEAEAAERLGRSRRTVRQWRYTHRHADGREALLEEAWDHNTDVNAGRIKLHMGRPTKYKLRGRPVKVRQVAEKLGVPVGTLYSHMHYHRCGLDATVSYYERKRQRQAEKRILEIINGD